MIRTVAFTSQKMRFSEANQLRKRRKAARTKKEQTCGARRATTGGRSAAGANRAGQEALWI
jgi:hypothetical protein